MKNKMKIFTKKYIISVYFTFTFMLSGILFLPYVLFKLDASGFVLPQLAPGITAVFIIRFVDGKSGIFKLVTKLKIWKVGFKWYLIALCTPIIILTVRMVIYGMISNTALVFFSLSKINLIFYIFPGVLIGAIGEEIGWRGFLLPILQLKMNSFKASLLLGVLWGFYHFPAVIGNGINIFLIFMISVTLLSIIVTWLYNNTNGSIIIPILFHTAMNMLTRTIFYSTISIKLYLAQMIANFILASIILLVYRNKSLSNQRSALKI